MGFDSLVFLGSERPLRKGLGELEDLSGLFNELQTIEAYETEDDMLKLIWKRAEIPQEMKNHLQGKVIFVSAPLENGLRPSREGTYHAWLNKYQPKPGTILAASSPLVCPHQHLVGINVLGPSYPLDTICNSIDSDSVKVSQILDTIAKCLYEYSLKTCQ